MMYIFSNYSKIPQNVMIALKKSAVKELVVVFTPVVEDLRLQHWAPAAWVWPHL